MFHVKHAQLTDVLDWAGFEGPPDLFDHLDVYASWLHDEGADAGGIGPDEAEAVWERHILDSLMFAAGFEQAPERLVDLGSGAGLPGIPLALLFPQAEVLLVDRSAGRMRIARRGARVCGADNVQTLTSDFSRMPAMAVDAAVMRASLPAGAAETLVLGCLVPGGAGVVGVGVEERVVTEGRLDRFPGSAVLDPGRWMHIMRR